MARQVHSSSYKPFIDPDNWKTYISSLPKISTNLCTTSLKYNTNQPLSLTEWNTQKPIHFTNINISITYLSKPNHFHTSCITSPKWTINATTLLTLASSKYSQLLPVRLKGIRLKFIQSNEKPLFTNTLDTSLTIRNTINYQTSNYNTPNSR